MSDDEKKIIIDEDWKSQAQAEKEALEQKQHDNETSPQEELGGLPPASFVALCSLLATQALASLGAVPDPVTGHAEVRLDQARYFVDLLGVLDEKTKGNLDPEEQQMIESILHQLRMEVVGTGPGDQPGGEPAAGSEG